MLKAGTPEKVDLNPVGTGPFNWCNIRKTPAFSTKPLTATGARSRQIDTEWLHHATSASVGYARATAEERMSGDAVSNPADIARMKEDKNINLMEAGWPERGLSLL